VYYGYLEVLNMLADLVGIDIDISKLPSAQDLQLPPSGSYGIQWFASPERVGLEIVFENNPLEFLAAQDMSSVMVIGILAAIAIPAYQDYTLRAQVSSTLAHAEPAKRWVEAFWLENKRFPNSADIAKFDFNRLRGGNISRVVMLPDTGAIVITMGGNATFKGKRILLKPAATQDGLQWSCKSELADKYMPMSCRG
jgi:Tfp pilus assembly major pilin PilA